MPVYTRRQIGATIVRTVTDRDGFVQPVSGPKCDTARSSIGTRFKNRVQSRWPGIKDCTDCKLALSEMNRLTPEQFTPAVIDDYAATIARRAESNAPHMWQRLVVRIDGLIDHPATRAIVRSILEEAIAEERTDKKKRPNRTRTRNSVRPRSGSRGFGGAFRIPRGSKARFITSEQLASDIRILSSKIPHDITAIAGIARSGLHAATMLAMMHHLPLFIVRQAKHDIVEGSNGWRLNKAGHHEFSGGKVLVVDDTVMTGNSLKAISSMVYGKWRDVMFASVYVNPAATRKPDIWAVELPWPHLLEWNLFNSVISPSVAVDFDGVLCYDCNHADDDDGSRYLNFIRTARPLYLPRRETIPLIVTARIEKYRLETVRWLSRYGVRYSRLVMHPAQSTAERNRTDIAAYKARHFEMWAQTHRASPGPVMFVESDDRQAREIAKATGRLVLCPRTGGCY